MPSEKRVRASGIARRQFLGRAAAAAAAIPLAGLGGWRAFADDDVEPIVVGGLPVTCNLTLPVACAAHSAAIAANAGGRPFEYSKYSGWPEVKESLMTGRIPAAFMLAPLVMDLKTKKIPVRIVSLGHRSGAVIMVRSDSSHQKFRDLEGKRIAVPSRFAVDYLFLRRMLAEEGMSPADIEVVEMPPPDMPAALYANAVDAYCTGEPFGAAAESKGYARIIRMTRDEWPKYICCVLTVREELIRDDRPAVQNLVNYVRAAGQWMDQDPANREKAIAVAAGRKFFNQDVNILRWVMEKPSDRVTYGDMTMVQPEFDEIMEMSIAAGTLKTRIPFDDYVDMSFASAAQPVTITL
jgi:NitT/TauT family transport system substrate-binding protein